MRLRDSVMLFAALLCSGTKLQRTSRKRICLRSISYKSSNCHLQFSSATHRATNHEVGSSRKLPGAILDSDSWRNCVAAMDGKRHSRRARIPKTDSLFFIGLSTFTTALLRPPLEVRGPLRTSQL